MNDAGDIDVAATVDRILAVAGLSVTAERRERLVRAYPQMLSMVRQLRIPELRDLEPSVIYSVEERS